MQTTFYNGQQTTVRPPPNMVQGRAIPQPGTPQAVPRAAPKRKTYVHMSTKNKSFLDMHHFLKSIGIKNNTFMLQLIDPDLAGIDPHDPNLSTYMKQKVLRECLCNYW